MAAKIEEFSPSAIDKPRVRVTSDKFKATFTVQPCMGGYVFYEIVTNVASLPDELKGKYTRMKEAVSAIERYERKHPGTKSVQLDKKREEWKKQDGAAKSRSGTGDVHQRVDNGEV